MENFVLTSHFFSDLIESGWFDLFLQFPVTFYTTDLAVCALKEKKYRDIVNAYSDQGHINVRHYSEDGLFQLLTFRESIGYGEGLSLADCSVIYLARELDCLLVSSDPILCSMAEPFVETRLSKYDWSAKTGNIYELIPLKL